MGKTIKLWGGSLKIVLKPGNIVFQANIQQEANNGEEAP